MVSNKKSCVNGISEQQSEMLKELPSDLHRMDTVIANNTNAIQVLNTNVANLESEVSTYGLSLNNIENFTIPEIQGDVSDLQEDVSDLDDRVTEVELGKDFNFVSETDDWSQYDDSNRIIIIRNANQKCQFIIPRGQSLNFMLRTSHQISNVNTTNHYLELSTRTITEVTPATTIVFKTSNIILKVLQSDWSVSYSSNTISSISKLSLSDWNGTVPGCVMYSDKPIS